MFMSRVQKKMSGCQDRRGLRTHTGRKEYNQNNAPTYRDSLHPLERIQCDNISIRVQDCVGGQEDSQERTKCF